MDYSRQIQSLDSFKNLKNEFNSSKVYGAYLFNCPDKMTACEFLLQIAKQLQTKNSDNPNATIAKIDANTHPDVLVFPKGKSFMVEDAIEIYDKVQVKPMTDEFKIFIINNIDVSTEVAQNKMLKTLEEPPKNVVFLMSCNNLEKVLQTIKSRSQKIDIGRIDVKYLSELLDCDEQTKKIALSFGDGYLGKTLDIVSNGEYIENYKNCLNIIKNLKKSDQIITFSSLFSKNKDIFENYLNLLSEFYRDLLVIKYNKLDIVKNKNVLEDLKIVAKDYSVKALCVIQKKLNTVKQKLESNVNLVTLADNMLLDILEVKFLCK